MPKKELNRLSIGALMLVLAGCIQLNPEASEELAREATDAGTVSAAQSMRPPSADVIESAVGNPRRRAADRERDSKRRAGAVLSFFQIGRGMTVLDLFSGGGYYTELLSIVVGNSGRVVAHNNAAYQRFAKEEITERYAQNRLKNVEQLTLEPNDMRLPRNEFDAVLMTLSYHDLYYESAERGWPRTDIPAFLAQVKASMKSGAVLGIVEHVAVPGSPSDSGGSVHRLDPAIIKRDMAAAGFKFEAESPILRNPDDDRSKMVFDPAVRGKTDRAVLRFRKP